MSRLGPKKEASGKKKPFQKRTRVTNPVDRGIRLQKVLASAGVGSRRECEEFIEQGRVQVDGEVVDELGSRVFPDHQTIKFDGEVLRIEKKVYYVLNKPKGYVCTTRDPDGRPQVLELLPATNSRLFTVGRLDMDSEGLIIVTNDGDLTERLTHPKFGVTKTYQLQVAGIPERAELQKLKEGLHFAEGHFKVAGARVKSTYKNSASVEVVMKHGHNREIRRLFARINHKVMRLKRISIANLKLKNLGPGEFRQLSREEISGLWNYVLHANVDTVPHARVKKTSSASRRSKVRNVKVLNRKKTKKTSSSKTNSRSSRPKKKVSRRISRGRK